MGRDRKAEFSFEARWGDEILDHGIATFPALVVDYKGALGLTDSEQCLVLSVFRFKWTAKNPRPSIAALAERLGWSTRKVQRAAASLEEKEYLKRIKRPGRTNLWDFGGLLSAALKLAKRDQAKPDEKTQGATTVSPPPLTHVSPEVEAEGIKAVQTAATPPAAETASPTENPTPLTDTHPPTPSSVPKLQNADLLEKHTIEALQPEEIEFLNSLNLTPKQQRKAAEMTPPELRAHLNTAVGLRAQREPEAKPKDPAEEIRTVEDVEHWARQIGYRDIQREIKALGAMVVLSKVIAFERAARHGEIRAHNKAGYFNWLLRNSPSE